jgi:hypothetical protein
MDRLHWQSLFAKLLVTATLDSHYCTCLGQLGQRGINRHDPICVAPPKVAKASTEGDIAGIIAPNFGNVNTA